MFIVIHTAILSLIHSYSHTYIHIHIYIYIQLGESVTGGGLSDELLQATFSVGLKGVKADNTKQVEELVLKTLLQITESGFENSAVEASMNTLEFRLRGMLIYVCMCICIYMYVLFIVL